MIPRLKGFIDFYIAPKRPKYHFILIDEKYLAVQKVHRKDVLNSKKHWLYLTDEFFDEPKKYNEYFESWSKKCKRIS